MTDDDRLLHRVRERTRGRNHDSITALVETILTAVGARFCWRSRGGPRVLEEALCPLERTLAGEVGHKVIVVVGIEITEENERNGRGVGFFLHKVTCLDGVCELIKGVGGKVRCEKVDLALLDQDTCSDDDARVNVVRARCQTSHGGCDDG